MLEAITLPGKVHTGKGHQVTFKLSHLRTINDELGILTDYDTFLPLGLVLGLTSLNSRTRLLILNQVLLVGELGVAEAQREGDKRNSKADTGNGKQALNILVRSNHGRTLRSTDGVFEHGSERLSVGVGGEGIVDASQVLLEVRWEDLGPNSTRHTVAERRADVVGGEVETSHDGELLVLEVGLERGLSRIREHTTSDTQDDLSANDTRLVGAAGVTSVADEQTESDEEQTGTGDDKDLETADLVDDNTQDGTGDDTGERVERGDSSSRRDAKVESNSENGKQVVTLHGPGKVEHASHTKRSPDGAILHLLEGNKRMRSSELPEDESRDADEANDERSNDMGLSPLGLEASGSSQRDKDQSKDGDKQYDSDDIEEPEELDGKVLEAELLEGRAVVDEETLLLGAVGDNHEADDERSGADGVDDAPHANTPSPGRDAQDSFSDITADPGVDDEGQSGNVTEEETSSGRGDIGDDNLDKQQDHGVANLVNDGAGRKGSKVLGDGLHNRSEGVEKDRHADKLDTTKDISNLSSRGLSSSSDNGSQRVDRRQKRMGVESIRSKRLVGVSHGTIETVGVSDEEDAKKDEDTVGKGDDLGNGLDTNDTGRGQVADGVGGRLVLVGDLATMVVGLESLFVEHRRRHCTQLISIDQSVS